ncbi:MAG: PKD domain-containing protein [Actinomycetota bacterium]|nr:PKD domain-containing protein [Actinomycetota bacterium]
MVAPPVTGVASATPTAPAAQSDARVEEGLIARYDLDEGGGTTVADSSGLGIAPTLRIEDPSAVRWTDGGLVVERPTLIASDAPAVGIVDAITATGALTVEAWVAPATTTQNGPARIVTLSAGTTERDLTLGQGVFGAGGDRLEARIRTTTTSISGTPGLTSPRGSLSGELQHVVVTRSADGATSIRVDGVEVASDVVLGDLSTWQDYRLALANELTGDRPWLGELRLVALYDRALTPAEIARNLAVGPDGGAGGGGNIAPVALATGTPLRGTAPLAVRFDGSASTDVDGELTRVAWDLGDGTIAAGAVVDHTFTEAGTYTARLSVTDDDSASANTFVTVTVLATPTDGRTTDGLLARYELEEGAGDVVHDTAPGTADPLDLRIADPDRVTWVDGGLRVDAPTIIDSGRPATGVIDPVRASDAITVEAWVEPANATQNGPARIVTISDGVHVRNVTVGQGVFDRTGDRIETRLRSTATSNGGVPATRTAAGTFGTGLTHVVFTRDASGAATVYVDGEVATTGTVAGELANWDVRHRLALANETDRSRPWLGTYRLVALYDRALTVDEVVANRDAGPDPVPVEPNMAPTATASADPSTGVAPLAVSLDASASTDPDGTIVAHDWDLGDGTVASGPVVEHTYASAGSYTATVTVTDDDGATATATVAVTATEPAGPRVAWDRLSSADGDLAAPGFHPQQSAAITFDVDGDGVDEAVVAGRYGFGPSVVWYDHDDGAWTRRVIELASLPMDVAAAAPDIDGDGDLDLVMGQDRAGRFVWWWENPSPDLDVARWTRRAIAPTNGERVHDAVFADVDGDGRDELLWWADKPARLVLAEVPDDPTVTPWPTGVVHLPTATAPKGLTAADLDGDGTVELVGAGSWFEWVTSPDGERSVVAHPLDGATTGGRVAVGQLVDGGRPEIVVDSGDTDGPLRMYTWDGTAWVGSTLVERNRYGHSLDVGDVDGDGHLDVLTAEMLAPGVGDPAMRVLYGDGAGGFGTELLATGVDNHESHLADLDGDGDLDIVAKPYGTGLELWLNRTIGGG